MEKVLPFRGMVDVVVAKTGKTEKEIAQSIGITPEWLSRSLASEKTGKPVSQKVLLRFKDVYSYELTGEKKLKEKESVIMSHMIERLIRVEAYCEILTEEVADAFGEIDRLTHRLESKKATEHRLPAAATKKLEELATRASKVAARRLAELSA